MGLDRSTRGLRHTSALWVPSETVNVVKYLCSVVITWGAVDGLSLLLSYTRASNLIIQTFGYDPVDPPCGFTHTVEVGSNVRETWAISFKPNDPLGQQSSLNTTNTPPLVYCPPSTFVKLPCLSQRRKLRSCHPLISLSSGHPRVREKSVRR